MRIQRAIALVGLLPAIAAANTGLIQVTGARSWSHPAGSGQPQSTRVVIEVSGPFQFRSDRATNPDRLFFDILGARPWIEGRRLATRVIADGLVKRIRIAETVPGTTRVVFDLEFAAAYTAVKLETPNRLVVELRAGASSALPVPSISRGAYPTREYGRYAGMRRFIPPPEIPFAQPQWIAPPFSASDSYQLPSFFLPDPLRYLAVAPPPQKRRQLAARSNTTRVLPGPVKPARTGSVTASIPANTGSGPRSLTRALGLKINRVVIDAGHGGHDQGTVGPNGVMEKDVVLDVALRVAQLVHERMGAEVVLTRSDDTFIPLPERTAIANGHRADLFLSIHANSSPASQVAGTETFFLNVSGSAGALDVAARENAGSEKSVGELRDLIQSITLNDKVEESRTFAQEIERAISANALKSNTGAKDRGIKRAPFVVLIGASMPSVLAEIGFLSNARDERNLSTPEYRQRVAEALCRGISQYSDSLGHIDLTQKTDKAEKRVAGLN